MATAARCAVLCVLALLLAGPLHAHARTCAKPLSSGNTTIAGTYNFDLEGGVQGGPASASDLWWHMVSSTTRSLDPLSGALLALMPAGTDFASLSLFTIQAQQFSPASIDGSDSHNLLTPGTVVAFKTRSGHFGKLLVWSIDPTRNHGLGISWNTYQICECVPTILYNGVTTLKGTWALDFDTGIQGGVGASDVWWHMVSSTTRFLEPVNGALLALMPAGTDFASLSFDTIKMQALSTSRIDGSDSHDQLTPGTVVAFKTRTGRYGKMTVWAYRDPLENQGLRVQWVTFTGYCGCLC